MIALPTTRADWRLLGRTTRLVLASPPYLLVAIAVGLLTTVTTSLSRYPRFVRESVVLGDLPLAVRLELVLATLPGAGPGLEIGRAVLTAAIAVLTGGAVAVLAYYVFEHEGSEGSDRRTDAAVVLGSLAAVTAAFGPAALAGAFVVAGVGELALLPYEGLEASTLAVMALVISTYWLAAGLRSDEIRGVS